MTLQFTKMHGLGNDFMVIDLVKQSAVLTSEEITALAKRNTGVGFDQCLIVEPSTNPDIDFFYRIYNSDGSEVGQCGNGARCLARFIHHYGLSLKKNITVATKTTRMRLTLNDDETVTVEMGKPRYAIQQEPDCLLIDETPYTFHTIDVGNPHAVILSNDVHQALLQTVGKQLCTHPFFPNQCNIGFMQIIDKAHIKLRVYERGAGETLACGSGAIAAVAIGALYHGLADHVTVSLPGGDLDVRWPNHEGLIFLTGPATFVYEGHLF